MKNILIFLFSLLFCYFFVTKIYIFFKCVFVSIHFESKRAKIIYYPFEMYVYSTDVKTQL